MIKPKKRFCVDCGKDISDRFILTKRCLECAYERDKRMARLCVLRKRKERAQ